jgi:hypothetical protein
MHRTPYVFGIGLPKTGTNSLTAALNILGIPTVHNRYQGTKINCLISANQSNNKKLLDPIDQEYQGFTDFDGFEYYETLYTQYPDSVFINTQRDAVSWFNSRAISRKIKHSERRVFSYQDVCSISDEYVELLAQYFEKTREIQEFFRDKPHRYLELDICAGDGWEKLCEFLNLPAPRDPFPWIKRSRDRLQHTHKRPR